MLAAGMGSRLTGGPQGARGHATPKSLLEFGGKSLLERHIAILKQAGVEELNLVLGYLSEEITAAIGSLGASDFIQVWQNPDYREGSVVSLWSARQVLTSGSDVIFMDADVLYHPDLINRLVASTHQSCLLLDRDFEAGDEPVKLCLRGDQPVEFRKQISGQFDVIGEWPGFLKLSAKAAGDIAERCESYVTGKNYLTDNGAGDNKANRRDQPCEEVFRDAIIAATPGMFGVEDITGLPWIEIDFPEDLIRAEKEILPKLPDTV